MDNIRPDTNNTQTNVFYRFIHKTIVFIFVNFVLIQMHEKLHSQHETVISMPTSWNSNRNRDTWEVCCNAWSL